jgi:hypothetical protein
LRRWEYFGLQNTIIKQQAKAVGGQALALHKIPTTPPPTNPTPYKITLNNLTLAPPISPNLSHPQTPAPVKTAIAAAILRLEKK